MHRQVKESLHLYVHSASQSKIAAPRLAADVVVSISGVRDRSCDGAADSYG